jgi:hypothetical protein
MISHESAMFPSRSDSAIDSMSSGTPQEMVVALVTMEMKLAFSYFLEEKWVGTSKKMVRKPLRKGKRTKKIVKERQHTEIMDSSSF